MKEVLLSIFLVISVCVVFIKIISHDEVSKLMTALIAMMIPISIVTTYAAIVCYLKTFY